MFADDAALVVLMMQFRAFIFGDELEASLQSFVVREIWAGMIAKDGRGVPVFHYDNFVIRRWVGKGITRQGEHCDQTE